MTSTYYTEFDPFLGELEKLVSFDIPIVDQSNFSSPFINRELSWLEFNERVLEEARDTDNPLLERLNFLSITSSNLDEFFMVRVASLKDMVNAKYTIPDPSGLKPAEQLELISEKTHEMVKKQYSTFNRSLIPALEREKISILKFDELDPLQRKFAANYFESTVFPVLTPLSVDAGSPFPLLSNKRLNLLIRIETEIKSKMKSISKRVAILQIPAVLPRIIRLPGEGEYAFILLEDIVSAHLDRLFTGVKIGTVSCFRIMRNADLAFDDEDAADLLSEIEEQVRQRQWGEVIRLEIQAGYDPEILPFLTDIMHINEPDIYRISGPLDLTLLSKLSHAIDAPELSYPPFSPQPNPVFHDKDDLFQVIRERDVILNHPYEAFDPVINLIKQAAADPDVLAIKQTLYRVSGQSPIINALAEAAISGKQVLALVELKARFDEENNIQWAKKLEQAGCHVIYGLVGLKTHSKITLIVRSEEDGIRRYVHLGTGNYNDITARIYTDFGLFTCSEAIGREATDFFNMISGYSQPLFWRKLVPAPKWLRIDTLNRIRNEQRNAEEGKPAWIVAKMNSLVDPEIIEALYSASNAGVKIALIVRGICCLRPGVKGLSENIVVRSLVGRFLEHARIYYFYNNGQEDLFLSSADWMPRNLDRRIELQFPVEGAKTRQRVIEVLSVQLSDTDRARNMHADGSYSRADRRKVDDFDSQIYLCEKAIRVAAQLSNNPIYMDHFVPREDPDNLYRHHED